MSATGSLILNKSGNEYELAYVQMFRDAMSERFREQTIFFPSPAGEADSAPQLFEFKALTSGQEHRFDLVSDPDEALVHTPGDENDGQQIEFDKALITCDRPIVASLALPYEHDILAHFNSVVHMGRNNVQAIANEADTRLQLAVIKAARTSALSKNGMTIHNGGNAVTRVGGGTTIADAYPDNATGSTNFLDDIADLALLMDEDNVPRDDRFLIVRPREMHLVTKYNKDVFNSDYTRDLTNSFNGRVIGELSGFRILRPYNRMHEGNTHPAKRPSTYTLDNSYTGANGQPVAIACGGSSVGCSPVGVVVAGGGLVSEMEYQRPKLRTFFQSHLMMGADVLHPWCAGVIQAKAS